MFLPFFLGATLALAQIPQVPNQLEFADLTIRITPQAQREIQLDVDALYRNPTYFKIKQDRVNLFMPVVERELRKQGVPDDLKYLVIQESGLISDAVSTSNAVGFWQFKQGTAEEVGLRIDNQVDERKSIVSSTRGAALYLKKHNSALNNWMTALVSYQMGLGGAKAYFGNQFSGKKLVEVDRNTHWYFKKYLAHKVAYQNQLNIFVSSGPRLVELPIQGPVSIATLAKRYGVSGDHLLEFNKWAVNGKIPAGSFTLFFLKEGSVPIEREIFKASENSTKPLEQTSSNKLYPSYKQADSYPRISGNTTKASQPNQITVNELKGVQASDDVSTVQFANEIGMKERKFRKLNDLKDDEKVEIGKYYYTQKKKTSAGVETHLVQTGETLWLISQKYGIRLSALKSKNRIKSDAELKPGMVLNLREPRKRGEEIPVIPIIEPSIPINSTSITSEPVRKEVIKDTENFEPKSTPSNNPAYHVVLKGETLFSISKRYGISVEDLRKWNSIGSQNIITVGQKLVIFKP